MPEPEQVELIDAHPRLGAPPGSVSPLSFREQGYDREAADAAAEAERARVASELARLNEAYEARFGFRYCVFVAGRPRAALLPELEAALHGPTATRSCTGPSTPSSTSRRTASTWPSARVDRAGREEHLLRVASGNRRLRHDADGAEASGALGKVRA